MRNPFPLFQSHLDLAHEYWQKLVAAKDILIDATCGNGHDTLFLAKLHPQVVWALDIQPEAIEATGRLLGDHPERVRLVQGSHHKFPSEIAEGTVKLIVYNLGYLPGGDKSRTTVAESTLESLGKAQKLLTVGGCISITCYPGHPEGKRETELVTEYCASLDPREWSVCSHRWENRKEAPILLLIQKSVDDTLLGIVWK